MKVEKTKTLCYGHFNTIHAGHIRYLRYGLTLGDELYIALRGDGEHNRYDFPQKERKEALTMLRMADEIISLCDDELEAVVNELKPNVILLGAEFKKESWVTPIIDRADRYGGKVIFHSGTVGQVSEDLIGKDESSLSSSRRLEFLEALSRQSICRDDLLSSIDSWRVASLIVVGDTILDQFVACDALGLSAEAPVVVVKELRNKSFIGGAAIVAAHIRSLGCNCSFVSVTGEDPEAEIIENELSQWGVATSLIKDRGRPTTVKKRYVVGNQKLFRVSRLEERDIDIDIENEVISRLRILAEGADGIVVSDFNYGAITKRVLDEIMSLKEKYGLKLFGDSQSSSQIGNLSRLKSFTLLTPNEREARQACGTKDWGVEKLANELFQTCSCKELIMKLGADGFITYSRTANGGVVNQQFPALTANPVDVAGAGDSLLSVMAAGICSGQKTMITSAVAACMASMAVSTMGNKPISNARLKRYIESIFQRIE